MVARSSKGGKLRASLEPQLVMIVILILIGNDKSPPLIEQRDERRKNFGLVKRVKNGLKSESYEWVVKWPV